MADNELTKKSLVRKTTVIDIGKIPPQNRDMEKAVLSAVLLDNSAMQRVIGLLKPETFYVDAHQRIWKACQVLYDKGESIDILTVAEQLRKTEDLEVVGGPYAIAQISNYIGSSANIITHALIMVEKYIKREAIACSSELIQMSYDETTEVEAILNKLEENVENLQSLFGYNGSNSKQAMEDTMQDIIDRSKGIINSQILTGWEEFDELLQLDRKRLIIVAADQKVGKTAMMLSAIKRIHRKNKKIATKIYSFEMDIPANMRRFIMEDAALQEKQLLSRNYDLTKEDKQKIKASKENINQWALEITDKRMSINELVRDYKYFCKRHKDHECICVIDNHGFLANSIEEDAECSKEYSYLRDETNSLIFVLHHLTTKGNKAFNVESGFEPTKDMVRGSSRILDYCNALILLHRPNYYDQLMQKLKLECTPEEYAAVSRLFLGIVPINRNGDTGMFRLKHNIATNTFISFPKI